MTRSATTRSQHILLLAQVARLAISLFIAGLLGRHLPAADFGLVALIGAIFALSQDVLDMGTTAVAAREVARAPADEPQIMASLLAWRRWVAVALAALCVALGFGPFALADKPALLAALAIAVWLLHLGAYHVVFQVRQAFGRATLLAMSTHVAFLIACLVTVGLHGAGVAVAFAVVAREIVQVLGSRVIARRVLGYALPKPSPDFEWRRLMRAAGVFGLTGVLYKLAQHSGNFFVWSMASPEALGSYSAAQRLVSPLRDVAWLFATPLIATLTAMAEREPDEVVCQLGSHARLLVGVAAAIGAAGVLVAPALLHWLYGERYSQGALSALPSLRWQILGACFALVTPILVVGKLAFGRERDMLWMSLAALVIAAMANAWAVPRYGAEGASAAYAVSEFALLALLWSRSALHGNGMLGARLVLYLVPAVLVAASVSALEASPALQFAVACVLVILSFGVLSQLREQRESRQNLKRAEGALPALAIEPELSREALS
ncbi:lipopolysaccharide biosynthesis protein [Piscinibacter terrae]|uniref:lipopolysaccharide biosynthesis protein n=1 Tax=Piscinibacter terrae TaxID=2496871 RepID=UPI00138732F7|nr:lipopolysaccharide biosynthesis protein [Albitalea terrae]